MEYEAEPEFNPVRNRRHRDVRNDVQYYVNIINRPENINWVFDKVSEIWNTNQIGPITLFIIASLMLLTPLLGGIMFLVTTLMTLSMMACGMALAAMMMMIMMFVMIGMFLFGAFFMFKNGFLSINSQNSIN